jgi:RHS repeat-associated protein
MGRKYAIRDQEKFYFVTFTIVYWLDVFIREEHKSIFLDSVRYCQKEKGFLKLIMFSKGYERNATTGWDETYFRMYDPAIGRFHGVDPLAVKYAGMTPYNYVGGNPIAFNDPLGDDYLNDNMEWVEYDMGCGCMNIQTNGGSSNGRAW